MPPSAAYAGNAIDVDAEGFFARAADWTPQIGEAVAREVSVGLSPDAWKVILFARDEFGRSGQTPGLRRISVATGVSIKDLYQLFPKGPAKLIARIAGVPKPKSCL